MRFFRPLLYALVVLLASCGSADQPSAGGGGDGEESGKSQTGGGDLDATAGGSSASHEEEHQCLHECDEGDDSDPIVNGPIITPVPGSGMVMRGLLEQDKTNALVWIYRIKNGHGKAPWNDTATAFQLKKGETWRILNEDSSTSHQLHTNGSPCAHGGSRRVTATGGTFGATAPIPVGGYVECDIKVTNVLDLSAGGNGQLYDHSVGQAVGVIHAKFTP